MINWHQIYLTFKMNNFFYSKLKWKFVMLIFSMFLSNVSFSQLRIPLLNNELTCIPCKMISDQENNRIHDCSKSNGENYTKAISCLESLIEEDTSFSANAKIVCLLTMIDIYTIKLVEKGNEVYNIAKDKREYSLFVEDEEKEEEIWFKKMIESARIGADTINNLFERAIALSPDEKTTLFLKRKRLYFMRNSNLIENLIINDFSITNYDNFSWEFENLDLFSKEAEARNIDPSIYNTVIKDFEETEYQAIDGNVGLNMGISSMYGKDLWLGGEISLDYFYNANPFEVIHPLNRNYNYRVAAIGASYMKNLSSNSTINDFAFYAMKFTNFAFVNFTPYQFGFQRGSVFPDNKTYWYYRPEIGFSYAIFSISYGYNLMFNKSIRGLAEKNIITFKISYPLVGF